MSKEFCEFLEEAIKDEQKGKEYYNKLAETFKESDNPGVRVLAILAEKLAQDEEGHRTTLIKVSRLVCSR